MLQLLLLYAAKACRVDLKFQRLPWCPSFTLKLHMMQMSPALQAQHA